MNPVVHKPNASPDSLRQKGYIVDSERGTALPANSKVVVTAKSAAQPSKIGKLRFNSR